MIELTTSLASAASATPAATTAAVTGSDASTPTVNVDLDEWAITPDVAEIAAGRVRFVAHNRSRGMVHELAVLRVGADGQKHEVAEIENVGPATDGEFVADLEPGNYELACLIAPGEAGSTVDHYQQGDAHCFHRPLARATAEPPSGCRLARVMG
ncbi:MAG: hypothetical protein O3B31_03135 [Chloroflexi bacterium]|nr:hypothetical protein [Chloroflexota bacterium]MDA1002336.1 hypothetical protein [Chloroflexota bacterium]